MDQIRVPLNDRQRAVATDVVLALEVEDWTALFDELAVAADSKVKRNRLWLSPPLLGVAAALLTVIADAAPEKPWQFTDDLWDEHLPDRKPHGRTQWRKASFAVHAAGCLAAGVWLDVGLTESYWQAPFWPDLLDVIDLLRRIAASITGAPFRDVADRTLELLDLTRPDTSPP